MKLDSLQGENPASYSSGHDTGQSSLQHGPEGMAGREEQEVSREPWSAIIQEKDQLHNLRGPEQSENMRPHVQKVSRISRW